MFVVMVMRNGTVESVWSVSGEWSEVDVVVEPQTLLKMHLNCAGKEQFYLNFIMETTRVPSGWSDAKISFIIHRKTQN
jgi:hypothetical protein